MGWNYAVECKTALQGPTLQDQGGELLPPKEVL